MMCDNYKGCHITFDVIWQVTNITLANMAHQCKCHIKSYVKSSFECVCPIIHFKVRSHGSRWKDHSQGCRGPCIAKLHCKPVFQQQGSQNVFCLPSSCLWLGWKIGRDVAWNKPDVYASTRGWGLEDGSCSHMLSQAREEQFISEVHV